MATEKDKEFDDKYLFITEGDGDVFSILYKNEFDKWRLAAEPDLQKFKSSRLASLMAAEYLKTFHHSSLKGKHISNEDKTEYSKIMLGALEGAYTWGGNKEKEEHLSRAQRLMEFVSQPKQKLEVENLNRTQKFMMEMFDKDLSDEDFKGVKQAIKSYFSSKLEKRFDNL